MALRPDEKFVLSRIVESLGGGKNVKGAEGEDPPDAYVKVGDITNLLEITQLSQFVINKDGTVQTRLTQDMFGLGLLDELDRDLGQSLPREKGLLIHLELPVEKPSKFKALLRQTLQELISKNELPKYQKSLKLDGAVVRIFMIPRDSAEPKRIIGLIESKNSSSDISNNAKIIIENRLSIKNEICAALPFNGSKWLGLLNQYWLADVETYRWALKETNVNHQFERIFFVQDTGEVHIL